VNLYTKGINLIKALHFRNVKRSWRWILGAFTIILITSMAIALTASTKGVVSECRIEESYPPPRIEVSAIPRTVINDAVDLSLKLLGKYDAGFINELLGSYIKSRSKDLVILFNPGGWGDNPIEKDPGWQSVLEGIQSQLRSSHVDSLVFIYRRTVNNVQGHLGELLEIFRGYPSKAKFLAYRVQFLTAHNPDIKVIIASDSMGSLISEAAMSMLSNNLRVFSIQTGPPPWRQDISNGRTLVLDDNGVIPDSFSRGDIAEIIKANSVKLLNQSHSEVDSGKILKDILAPGHDYSWQYPVISSQITHFLKETVAID
jgi:hypothetical protein